MYCTFIVSVLGPQREVQSTESATEQTTPALVNCMYIELGKVLKMGLPLTEVSEEQRTKQAAHIYLPTFNSPDKIKKYLLLLLFIQLRIITCTWLVLISSNAFQCLNGPFKLSHLAYIISFISVKNRSHPSATPPYSLTFKL